MGGLTRETEERILFLLPILVKYAQNNFFMTRESADAILKAYPDVFKFAVDATPSDVIEFNLKYANNPVYGKDVRFFMTDQGREYVVKFLQLAKEYAGRHNIDSK